jgi:predicted Rossmann-fold nucleotide-binding protein|tara:strand:+ start:2425 stop:2625 length:201 start_codon:yes stop_codon:yes gene_type:complete
MIIELAMVGFLKCQLVKQEIVDEDRKCYYICVDTSKEFASTLKQYQCPKVLYEDRPALPYKDRYKN